MLNFRLSHSWAAKFFAVLLTIVMAAGVFTAQSFADVQTPEGEYRGTTDGRYNTFTVYNGQEYEVAYCFNYRLGFSSSTFGKITGATAEDLWAYAGMTPQNTTPRTDYASNQETADKNYESVLKAVYNGYPRNGGGENENDSTKGIWKESGLGDLTYKSNREYLFRLATQCAVWHFTDGAELADMESHVAGITNLSLYPKARAAFEKAYNMLIDSENLSRPDDYKLDLYVHKSNPSVQNLLTTRSTEQYDSTVEVKLTKTWKDASNAAQIRPSAEDYLKKVHLMKQAYRTGAGGSLVKDGDPVEVQVDDANKTCVDNGDNTYTVTFKELPAYSGDDSTIFNYYTIVEDGIDGYDASEIQGGMVNGYWMTNTAVVNLKVKKIWRGKKGEKAVVNLLENGDIIDTVELNEGNHWEAEFKNLTRYNSNGEEISYTIEEEAQNGYTITTAGSVKDGFVLTNTEVTDISVKKIWEGAKGEKAVIHLTANGKVIKTVELNEKNRWKTVFKDMPTADENNKPIRYSITEDDQDGYVMTLAGSAEKGFVVTNKEVKGPKTGDSSNAAAAAVVLGLAAAGTVVLLRMRKRSE